jgi:hypothetical protein
LIEVLKIIRSDRREVLSKVKGTDCEIMKAVVKRIENLALDERKPFVSPLCDLVQNGELRQKAKLKVGESITALYNELYDVISDPSNQYGPLTDYFKGTPKLVRTKLL